MTTITFCTADTIILFNEYGPCTDVAGQYDQVTRSTSAGTMDLLQTTKHNTEHGEGSGRWAQGAPTNFYFNFIYSLYNYETNRSTTRRRGGMSSVPLVLILIATWRGGGDSPPRVFCSHCDTARRDGLSSLCLHFRFRCGE